MGPKIELFQKTVGGEEKTSVGAFGGLPHSRSLLTNHRDCINASFTQLAPSSLDNGLGPMSVVPNFI